MPAVPVLQWKQLFDKLHNAQVLADSSIGTDWVINLQGTGPNNERVTPQTVIVDNMGNDATVEYTYGVSSYEIPAFTRRTMFIKPGQRFVKLQATKGVVTLTFCDFNPDLPDEQNEIATNQSSQGTGGTGTGTGTGGTGTGTGAGSGQYTILNVNDKAPAISITGAGLVASQTSASIAAAGQQAASWNTVRGVNGKTSGKWYFEMKALTTPSFVGGICLQTSPIVQVNGGLSAFVGAQGNGYGYTWAGTLFNNAAQIKINGIASDLIGVGDIARFAVDVPNRKLWAGRVGGKWFNTYYDPYSPSGIQPPPQVPADGTGGYLCSGLTAGQPIFPACSLLADGAIQCNFGQSPFVGPIPAGFKGWET